MLSDELEINFIRGDCHKCRPGSKRYADYRLQLGDNPDIMQGTGMGPNDTQISSSARYYDALFPAALLTSMQELRLKGDLCDVILEVEGRSLHAHRSILAAASPYFRIMFCSGMKESREETVCMQGIDYESMSVVLDFIYSGRAQLNEWNIVGVVEASDFLQIKSLRPLCIQFLNSHLNCSSCLATWQLANLRSWDQLASEAFRFARTHFQEVMLQEDFMELNCQDILAFLDAPFLNVNDETMLLQRLVAWVEHSRTERQHYLPALLAKVDVAQVAPERLLILLQDEEQYIGNHEAIIRPRCQVEQEILVTVGGESSGLPLASAECFALGYDSWKCSVPSVVSSLGVFDDLKILPTLRHPRQYPAVTAKDHFIYVVGGLNGETAVNSLERYSGETNEWRPLAPLPVALHGAGATFLDGRLIVVGGRADMCYEKRTWAYDERTDSWSEMPPMNQHRGHLGVTVLNGVLYAVGGLGGTNKEDEEYLNSCERLDPALGRWVSLEHMREPRAYLGCAAVNDQIYALGGFNGRSWLRAVESYSPARNQWTVSSAMIIPRSSFAVSVCSGRVYCIGGFDGIHSLNTVEKFNPRTNRWHCVHSMQVRRFGPGAATLRLPLRRLD